jgi:hypothetical protein
VDSLWQPIGKAHVLQYKQNNQAPQTMNNQNNSKRNNKQPNTTCGLRGKTKRSSDTNRYSQYLMTVIHI